MNSINIPISNYRQDRGGADPHGPLPGLGAAAAAPPLRHRRADRPAGHVRLRRGLRRRLGRHRHQQLALPRRIRLRRRHDNRLPHRRRRVLLCKVFK